MAITAITPVSASTIAPGDEFSFTIDDTYTSMIIEVETDTGWEYAYDSSLGGAQLGYTVLVVDNGATDTFTVGRDAGFNLDVTQIRVTENETGVSATTTFTYTLSYPATFPQTSQPYFNAFTGGVVTVSEENVVVRNDVRQIDFDGDTFNVASAGSGKVTVTGVVPSMTDANAIHKNVAGEIAALTLVTLDAGDHLVIEDASDANNKKRISAAELLPSSLRKLSTLYSPLVYFDFNGTVTNSGSEAIPAITVSREDFQVESIIPGYRARGFYGFSAGTCTRLTTGSFTPSAALAGSGNITVQCLYTVAGSTDKQTVAAGHRTNLVCLAASGTDNSYWWGMGYAQAERVFMPQIFWLSGTHQELTATGYSVPANGIIHFVMRLKPNGGNMDASLWINGRKLAESLNVAVNSTSSTKQLLMGEFSSGDWPQGKTAVYESVKVTAALSDAEIAAEWAYVNGE